MEKLKEDRIKKVVIALILLQFEMNVIYPQRYKNILDLEDFLKDNLWMEIMLSNPKYFTYLFPDFYDLYIKWERNNKKERSYHNRIMGYYF